jgi:hypothetical protein
LPFGPCGISHSSVASYSDTVFTEEIMIRLLSAFVLCLCTALVADVSSLGSGTPTLDLQQKGNSLTGTGVHDKATWTATKK